MAGHVTLYRCVADDADADWFPTAEAAERYAAGFNEHLGPPVMRVEAVELTPTP